MKPVTAQGCLSARLNRQDMANLWPTKSLLGLKSGFFAVLALLGTTVAFKLWSGVSPYV